MKQAQFAPHIEKGKQKGFKLISVRPGSFVSKLGAQAGDVILSIDDEPINTMSRAFTALSKSKKKTAVTVAILRNGQRKSILIKQR